MENTKYNEMVCDRENTIIRLKFELERQYLKNYVHGRTTEEEEQNMKRLNKELKELAIIPMAESLY